MWQVFLQLARQGLRRQLKSKQRKSKTKRQTKITSSSRRPGGEKAAMRDFHYFGSGCTSR
jgi:hypothetical protein